MTVENIPSVEETASDLIRTIDDGDLASLASTVAALPTGRIVELAGRLSERELALMFRPLTKDRALEVFEALSPALQSDLVDGLQDSQVAALFAELDPDDRAWLFDELPASVASRLLRGLPPRDRQLTAEVLGYPQGSVGRRMSPEYVSVRPDRTADCALRRVREKGREAETVYTLPVVDDHRRLVGVISLRDLFEAEPGTVVADLMQEPHAAQAASDAEEAARRCTELGLLALPIVDSESRLVGILTVDDAVRILRDAEKEDSARQGGVEPLSRPYLSTPALSLMRSRVVWLLVLAVGATLTVRVLSAFEATLEQVTVLALFVPLLIGTGGNTGNQAATTVTRAIAVNEVRPRDALRVLAREARVGGSLGILLGTLGFTITAVVFDPQIGAVIGLTLLAVCTAAATVGGLMPLAARAIGADPAVFSNPFISTFVDAAGLVIYFAIARAVLGI
ncbi:magnesium transporter [Brevibacterium album]|uniref:magnesium transporter n=1 Tax=Brevibacterium album TaxID=417948 RepID=UPI0004903D66|nr:magnesium transporter [Brevibacterium album]